MRVKSWKSKIYATYPFFFFFMVKLTIKKQEVKGQARNNITALALLRIEH